MDDQSTNPARVFSSTLLPAPSVSRFIIPNAHLPPASAQSFLIARKMPVVVISDFDNEIG